MLPTIDWTKRELLILAFDHRGTFLKNMFGLPGGVAVPEDIKTKVSEFKMTIYEGFKRAIEKGVPRDIGGILVDEEYGSAVAMATKKEGVRFAMPCEKSGQDEFDFDYGEHFGVHIEKFEPTFAKVLVRMNPEGDRAMNERQLARLKRLGDYLQSKNRAYLFELLVPATKQQLEHVGGDKARYDLEIRPKLMVWGMAMVQAAGVEPDLWKMEGVERAEDALAVAQQAQSAGRKAGVITLGRGESKEKVKEWLKVGAKIPGVIGFAVGRTIFWDPLMAYYTGKQSREQAVEQIAQNYYEFVQLWIREKNK